MNVRHRPAFALLTVIPIATLGGLIGLGGAEFRLPVLAGPLHYSAKRAVPLNLVISMVTLTTALVIRERTLSLAPVVPFTVPVVTMIFGAVCGAFAGTALVGRLSNERLQRTIFVLLLIIGIALLLESFLPQSLPPLVPETIVWGGRSGSLSPASA